MNKKSASISRSARDEIMLMRDAFYIHHIAVLYSRSLAIAILKNVLAATI
jgi:hypothetical protein